jgi:uncharacterized Zn finger protein (UPF0148 family)
MYSCPYCGYDLKAMPQRKKRCPFCQRTIYVKSTPDNRNKRIMTEAQAISAEEKWDLYNARQSSLSVLFPFELTEQDIERERVLGATDDREAVISLVTCVERKTNDLHKRKMSLLLLAAYAEEDGRPFHEYLIKAKLCELHYYKQSHVKRVEILTAGSGNACTECESNAQKVFEIDDALRIMPLPHPMCTRTIAGKRPGFCRCSYIPALK